MTPRYAVFGQPIAHSLSPRIHAMFGAQFDIAIDYRTIETSRAGFAAALDAFARDGGLGANVTLPLKEDAFALSIDATERARRCGSVNTLIRSGQSWRGDSTDGIGLLRDLRLRLGFDVATQRCILLGAGGAARAVAFALVDAGAANVTIANRTSERARALASAIGNPARVDVLAWDALAVEPAFDLVIDATSAGHAGAALDLPQTLVSAHSVCYDLSYGSAAAPFLAWAREAGVARASDGLGMLVEQAAESFAIWHGKTPDTNAVYDTLRAGIA